MRGRRWRWRWTWKGREGERGGTSSRVSEQAIEMRREEKRREGKVKGVK